MDNLVKSSFTFGVLLVVVGLIGNYFEWKQAPILLLLGIVFESFAAMAFIWKKMRK